MDRVIVRTLIPIQSVAQMVYDLVTPVPGEGHSSSSGVHQRRAPHQPQDFREGVSNAYDVVTEVSARFQTSECV